MTVSQMLALLVAIGTTTLGTFLLSPKASKGLMAFPHAHKVGCVLSTVAWGWTALQLCLHPLDFLSFLTPTVLLVGTLICIPLTCFLLENLLSIRGFGALMMLWPMPVFMAVREEMSVWRLLPVSWGYVALTLGMIFVFHPWTGRALCELLAKHKRLCEGVGLISVLLGILIAIGSFSFGEVIGQ